MLVSEVDEVTLREGDEGAGVRRLQEKLLSLGALADNPDGVFGYKTKRAIRCIQRVYGLRTDGIVGRQTKRVLERNGLHISSYTPGAGENLNIAAERLGTTPVIVARANRLNRYAPLEGSSLIAAERVFLHLGYGHFAPVALSEAPCGVRVTSSIYAVGDDGCLLRESGSDAKGAGIPVFHVAPSQVAVLATPRTRIEAVRQIKHTMARLEARAAIIDLPAVKRGLAEASLAFLGSLRRELGRSKKLIIAVALREGEESHKSGADGEDMWLYSGRGMGKRRLRASQTVVDIGRLAKWADYILLKCWREACYRGESGYLAPLPWVAATIVAAGRSVDRSKLLLGVSGAVAKWNVTAKTADVTSFDTVARVLRAYGTKPTYEIMGSSPVFRCKRRHEEYEYYFEDETSIGAKARLVDRLGLAGMALFDAAWSDPHATDAVESVFLVGDTVLSG